MPTLTLRAVGFAARTRVADPAFLKKAQAENILEIPTKAYADLIFPNITDVSGIRIH